jgi:hypothetical protein
MATNNGLPSTFRKARKASVKQGWTWEENTRHITVRDPKGDFVASISCTMYEGTLAKKLASQLRKAGCPSI